MKQIQDNQIKFLCAVTGKDNVSRETLSQINNFSEMLLKWNAKINLVSKKISSDELWQRHILDSAQLIKYLPGESCRIIDFGSGAGFPPLILAMLGNYNVTAVESDQRKCAFMQEACVKFGLQVKIINSRIEELPELECDVITSRALASVEKLLDYSENILQSKAFMLLLKGQNVAEEINQASIGWKFHHEFFPDAFNQDGKVLKISNARRL